MIKTLTTNGLLFGLILIFFSFHVPSNWFKAGSKPNSYTMYVDKGSGEDGKTAVTIKSIDEKINGFGTLMQQCKPNKYLGKRIKMSGYVKSENVSGWSGLWVRVDQSNSDVPLSFDNMHDRTITGTTDWKKYEIILDVPNNASLIAFGALLSGTGQIWFDKLSFEIVDDNYKTTGSVNGKKTMTIEEPSNLDFEE